MLRCKICGQSILEGSICLECLNKPIREKVKPIKLSKDIKKLNQAPASITDYALMKRLNYLLKLYQNIITKKAKIQLNSEFKTLYK